MSKRFRFILVILSILIGAAFLYPTVRWYFFVPEDQKALASGSREQIRQYAQRQAREEYDQFRRLNPSDTLPAELAFLNDIARKNYRDARKPVPEPMTAMAVLESFPGTSRDERGTRLYQVLEGRYRDSILALKDQKSSVLQLGLDLSGGMSVVLEADMASLARRLGRAPTEQETAEAMESAIEILSNRIDQFGVTEPEIRRQGENQIVIDIPGDADPERVQSFLRGRGSLTFHLVDDEATQQLWEYVLQNPGYNPDLDSNPEFIPAGFSVRGYYIKDQYNLDQLARYIVVRDEIALDGSHLESAVVGRHPVTGQPTVNFVLDREGGEIFFKITEANRGKSLAVLMDDRVRSYAVIQDAIRDNVQISGLDQNEAQNLAIVLRTASLPIDLNIASQQQVGASLGEDAIQSGIRASLVGLLLVAVFMVLYYKGAGLIADIALILNMFLMVAILSAFNLTLTLTSIAGLVLTVGMAVDANVIIYERMKEEYRLGKTVQACIKAGYQKAFWSIMDANITTLIAAVFLLQLGSGPIRGFAVTLTVGIITTLFTALFVSHLIFDFTSDTLKASKLSISWRI
jgi:preprotein translocase subunit SecD